MRLAIFILIAIFGLANGHKSDAQKKTPELVATIQMPNVTGRIDHLAVDLRRQLVFVAALGNNTIEVANLQSKKVIHTITGLHKPQGIIFIPDNDVVFVANGDTGECDIFSAETFKKVASVKLSGDADNVRFQPAEKRIYVGYADGGIAIIDGTSYKLLSEIKLSGHPESFQIDNDAERVFVNVPDTKQIEVVDVKAGAVTSTWKMKEEKNYPMALDEKNHRLFVGFGRPARLLIFDTTTGKTISSQAIDGDVDDIFYHAATNHVYLSCGDGYVDVFKEESPDKLILEVKVVSRPGARTCLIIPELDQLIVASPLREDNMAALLVYKLN